MLAAAAVSAAVLLASAVGSLYLDSAGAVAAFDGAGLSKARPPAGAGQNVLLIGSDSRAGRNGDFAGGTGEVGHSDTTILLHVYADGRHAIGVSMPRDALVDIPPCRLPDGTWSEPQTRAMFNSAFSVGGSPTGNPACTQNTVEKLTGLRVDHTVVVDFAGFAAMTDAVGGVQVCVPNDVYQGDLDPGLGRRGDLVFAKGLQTVSGGRALDYVRLRHGIGDGSDIGRMRRQQAFVGDLIRKVRQEGFGPDALLPLARAATRSLTVDPGLDSAGRLLSFALSLKDVDLRDIAFVTAPWRYQGARIDLVHPDVDALWAAMRDDRTVDNQDASGGRRHPAPPSDPGSAAPSPDAVDGSGVRVSVYNGTSVPGLAGRAAALLRRDGFTVTGTASALPQDRAATVIEYGPAGLPGARLLAALFPGSRLERAAVSGTVLVLGQDYAAAAAPDAAPPTAVPTSVAGQARSAADDPCSNLSYG